jgi:uncharacterized protein YndB with AHSA1/START domain
VTERLVIERHVAALPARVWALWTTTDGLAQWWWNFLPGTTYEVDLRIGGNYRIENPNAGFGVRGTFQVVEHERRLVATWVWLDATVEGAVEHLEVRFEPDGAGTSLTIVHDGPWTTPEPAAAYAQGWGDTLTQLDALFV